MATLVIRTQIMSRGSRPSHYVWEPIDNMDEHWRRYGGDLYVMNNMPAADDRYMNAVMASLFPHLERTGEYIDETVARIEWYDNDVKIKEFADEWEDPTFISGFRETTIDGDSYSWHCKRVRENRGEYDDQIDVIYESWVLKEGAARDTYRAFYHLINGDVLSQEQFEELYK